MIRITETDFKMKSALTRQIECDSLEEYRAVINSNLNTVPARGDNLTLYAWGSWQKFKETLSTKYKVQ